MRLPGFIRHRVTIAGRHPHERLRRRRVQPTGRLVALLAIVGPGVLAGLSNNDPSGITTYSVLGADYGYELIWALTLSTAAVIVFHEVAARAGVVTGKGMLALIRAERGRMVGGLVAGALLIANFGTLAAQFAGLAAGAELLAGVGREFSVPIAAAAVCVLVLRGSFHRVEHLLLLLSSVFIAYVIAGFLAGPDWGEAARGAVTPTIPGGRDEVLAIVATLGTTLAPWGIAFLQSYAVDKKLKPRQLGLERVDVVIGALMTGVIGLFIVVTCAATLHAEGIEIDSAADAALALEPLAGDLAKSLFGIGFIGAALLAIAVIPLSTAYSLSEARGRRADLDAGFREEPFFYGAFLATTLAAAGLVMIPGIPIIPLLYLSQALNAILLVVILPFIRHVAADESVMGEHKLGPAGRAATGLVTLGVLASVITLGILTI